jgi:hypothetical protein
MSHGLLHPEHAKAYERLLEPQSPRPKRLQDRLSKRRRERAQSKVVRRRKYLLKRKQVA